MPSSSANHNLYSLSSLSDAVDTSAMEDSHLRSWWTVYTRARQEKALAGQLSAYRIPFYLPLAPHQQTNRDRTSISHLPLFSNFLFLYGNEDDRLAALTTRLVCRMLPVDDQQRLRRDLLKIQQLLDEGASLTVESRVPTGPRVRIGSGPLNGLEGILIERSGGHRLLLAVEEIGQGVSVATDNLLLEPADPCSVEK